MVDFKFKQKNPKLPRSHVILVSLTKEFKTSIAKDMYRITWTAGSVSLAAICAAASDLNFDKNGQCRKESRVFSACMRLTLDNMISRICTCSFLHRLWLLFAGWLSYFGIASYLTYEKDISRFEQSPAVSRSCQYNSFLMLFEYICI